MFMDTLGALRLATEPPNELLIKDETSDWKNGKFYQQCDVAEYHGVHSDMATSVKKKIIFRSSRR